MEMVTLAILEMVVIAIVFSHGIKVNKDYSVHTILLTFASIIVNSLLGMQWFLMVIPMLPVGVWVYRIAK